MIKISDELKAEVNHAITYRTDSSIYVLYHNYLPLNRSHGPDTKYPLPSYNYASGKTKMAAWFVTKCNSRSPRNAYAKELSRYIEVDIYGKCGTKYLPRSSAADCFKLLEKDYKFYLSFENSLCPDYITEKVFRNAYFHNVIPIVMGASIEEYKRVSPPHSFIHIDLYATDTRLNYFSLMINSKQAANMKTQEAYDFTT
ncbi:unnamed protein product [Heterobilharzia americana]|nr:unnamed protein product [Heterobilharzia americana]